MSIHLEPSLCPAHVVWPQVSSRAGEGEPVFPPDIATSSLTWLRFALEARGLPNASGFGLHSLRRGSVQKILDKGGDLGTIMRAGSWRSGAFKTYLDMVGLQRRVVASTFRALVDLDEACLQ